MDSRSIEKRLLVTRRESNQLTTLLRELEDTLDCNVVYSSFMRALMRLAVSHGEGIIARAEEREGELSVPQRGDEEALLHYENEIAEMVREAFVESWSEEDVEAHEDVEQE